jgi:hypothetical protein
MAIVVGFSVAVISNYEYPPFPDYHWRENVFNYYDALLATRGPSPRPSEFRIVVLPPAYEWNLVLPLYQLSVKDRHRIELILAERPGELNRH